MCIIRLSAACILLDVMSVVFNLMDDVRQRSFMLDSRAKHDESMLEVSTHEHILAHASKNSRKQSHDR